MHNFLSFISGNKTTEILLMSWADKHPYLFTFIQTVPTTALIIAGFNIIVKGMFQKRARR